jgi:hypothetical protein
VNPLFDRHARERLERVDAALSESAGAWRRAPSPELRERILASIDAAPQPARSEPVLARRATRTLWLALAASCLIAWVAWQSRSSSVPSRAPVANVAPGADGERPGVERTVVHVSAESLVRGAWEKLSAPSIARSLDRPLVAEVGNMRADALRAVDFFVARVSLPPSRSPANRAHGN